MDGRQSQMSNMAIFFLLFPFLHTALPPVSWMDNHKQRFFSVLCTNSAEWTHMCVVLCLMSEAR